MTHSPTPILDQQRARGVETNGKGKVTTSHLNLSKTMTEQVTAEVEDKARHVTAGRSKANG
jgi:hypothetical protein